MRDTALEMRTRNAWRDVGISTVLLALVWFVFGQTIRFPFINLDDPEYVYEVPEINSGLSIHNIKWAFTHWPATNWFPLKNISHMIEFSLFGPNAGAFHATNVLLHTISVLLLFLLLLLTTGAAWRAAFVAALFAIHPLRVESVIWIEERKDVLSGVFFMLTLLMYFYYTLRPSVTRYVTMSILFAAGMLSKAMLVTTPIILLLLDYWPLGRMRSGKGEGQRGPWSVVNGLVVEKIPLLVISAAVAALTSYGIAPTHSAADQLPLFTRIGNAFVSYVIYIWQTIWPAKLGLFYPYPKNGLPIWEPIVAAIILFAITLAVFTMRRSRPYLFVGWVWYIVMLLPVIGIIQVNLQAHADRYTYLPQIGLCLMVAWGVADLLGTFNLQRSTFNIRLSGTVCCSVVEC